MRLGELMKVSVMPPPPPRDHPPTPPRDIGDWKMGGKKGVLVPSEGPPGGNPLPPAPVGCHQLGRDTPHPKAVGP